MTEKRNNIFSELPYKIKGIKFTLDSLHQTLMEFGSICERLQGAADARQRARRRTHVLQVPVNATGAVPCERLPKILCH